MDLERGADRSVRIRVVPLASFRVRSGLFPDRLLYPICCFAALTGHFFGATISVIRPTLVSPVNRLPCESMAM